MKTYIYYILFLLSAFMQPLIAQDVPVTKAQPPFPALPHVVTYTADPTGGRVELSISPDSESTTVASGEIIYSGETVTLKVTANAGYQLVFGSPKVYLTGESSSVIPLNPGKESGTYTFVMPAGAVTVDVEFEPEPTEPSSDARLKSLQYKVGDDGEQISIPGFTVGTTEYTVTLPSSTADNATITLSGTQVDAGASLSSDVQPITLIDGSGSASLTVTAADGIAKNIYTVHFQKAVANKCVVTILTVDGGTITVTDADGKVVKSGDVVDKGSKLTLTNTAVAGYTFSNYVVNNNGDYTNNSVTVSDNMMISAVFTPPAIPMQQDNIGTPAVTEINAPIDAPIVIIPDAASLPQDTEMSQLRLLKEEVDESKTEEVKAKAIEEALNEDITIDNSNNVILMEVTLVKVTTVSSDGNSEITVTPVQPLAEMQVCIPYPSGTSKDDYDFTIIHLKSDGSADVYSQAKGNLTLKDNYMVITVTGFSPFAVAYVVKSSPDPGPDPSLDPDPDPDSDPTQVYYSVTLPAVEGITTNPGAGEYKVKEWDNFRFYLTLDKEYDQSVPVVTTDRGETLIPRTSDGAYIIEYVRSAVSITISGIHKNTSVANGLIQDEIKIWVEASSVCIETIRPEEVRIVSASGHTVAAFKSRPGINRQSLLPGLYIIQAGRTISKMIIR